MEPMSYIGRKPCGCVVFAMRDKPEYKRDLAKELAKCIRLGLTIERVNTEYVRQNMTSCPHIKDGSHGEKKA